MESSMPMWLCKRESRKRERRKHEKSGREHTGRVSVIEGRRLGGAMIFRDRQRGMPIGLAGDALGAAEEFEVPGSFEAVSGYRGGGPHGLEPGEWTDDTSMALALADSIAEEGWDRGLAGPLADKRDQQWGVAAHDAGTS
jgi:hypothetical protein